MRYSTDLTDQWSLLPNDFSPYKTVSSFYHRAKKSGLWQKVMPKIWSVLPIRWIVERSFGWASHSRRLSRDYEISTESSENMLIVSHLARLLRRF